MSATDRSLPSTTRFPGRNRSGLALGLDWRQWLGVVIVGLLTFIALFAGLRPTLRGVIVGSVLVLGVLTFVRIDGRSGLSWARLAISHERRKRAGHTLIARPMHVGPLPIPTAERGAEFDALPGPWAALKVFEVNNRAYVFDPAQSTMALIAQLRAPDFLLASRAEQNARVAGWGRALAAACQSSNEIAQVQVLERLTPARGDALEHYAAFSTDPTYPDASHVQAYSELIGTAGRGAPAHEVFLVVSVRRSAATRRLRIRNQATALIETVEQVAAPVVRALDSAGLKIVDRPNARELGIIVRSAFDPRGALRGPSAGPLPATAGPTGGFEDVEYVYCDGMYHAVMQVFEWPKGNGTAADFLWDIVFPDGMVITRALSLFYKPYSVRETRRTIQSTHSAATTGAKWRDKLGKVETLEDNREVADLYRREAELDQGHREVGIGALITVSAQTRDDLDEAVSIMESAGHNANIDIRRLRMQQWQAFCAGALPLGRVVV